MEFTVSIPFKRERGYKVVTLLAKVVLLYFVSIPFKRERGYKGQEVLTEHTSPHSVSIPFKRERGYKDFTHPRRGEGGHNGFNSLQTGTRSQRVKIVELVTSSAAPVSIPFKRERGAKVSLPEYATLLGTIVSIPFKRERGAKDVADGNYRLDYNGFNSLQTGTRSQRRPESQRRTNGLQVSIPFKRERGAKDNLSWRLPEVPFVSIPFKRERGYKGKREWFYDPDLYSFNSLQTGKRIQRLPTQLVSLSVYRVSIPFKRERGYKD